MRLRFGPYAGSTTEVLVLRAPDYVAWTLSRSPNGRLAQALRALSAAFDAKPFVAPCRCGAAAVAARAYKDTTDLILLCEGCAERLPPSAVLDDVTAYAAALEHVSRTCIRRVRRQQRRIVRCLALAKGMPRRFTQPAAAAFLCSDERTAYPDARAAPDRRRVLEPRPAALANSLRRAE